MILKYRNVILLILIITLFSIGFEQIRSQGVWDNGRFEIPLRDLETIQKEGRLRVVINYNPTSYYVYRGKPMGYKYELLKELARELHVELDLFISGDLENTFTGLETGRYDLAARNLTITGERSERVDFTVPIDQTRQMLVQRKPDPASKNNAPLIQNVLELANKQVIVQKNSVFFNRLKNLQEEIGQPIHVLEDSTSTMVQLAGKVSNGEIYLTVCDENMANIYLQMYPNLDISLPVSFRQNIAWAVRKDAVHLKKYIDSWLTEFKGTHRFKVIHDRYYKRKQNFYAGGPDDWQITGKSISGFDTIIRRESMAQGWDWRLISAIIHQESKFDPDAVSYAGAIGLMQLMPETAKSFGIVDVHDPEQNIRAGVQLLTWLNKQFSTEIADEKERLKFVLGSYNVGLGHIRDAQRLTGKYEKNPSSWNDVATYLKYKSEEKYYSDEVVRWGYCNGREPYEFVRLVLSDYERLTASVR